MSRGHCERSHTQRYGRLRNDVKDVNVHEADSGKRATIRDVATRAGVSHQTVSRVINLNPNVAEHTRQRVQTAIRDLGYVPSPMARGLISNRTRSLGVVADDISDGFFARMVAGAEAEARRRGYYLMIGSVEPDDDERGYLRLMLERRVEGLILARPSVPLATDDLQPARSAGVPLVVVGASELPGFPIIDVDNQQGGYDATRHLLEHGHERIATIVGPRDWPSAAARLAGYRRALQEAGLEEDPALVEYVPDWGLESGQAAAARLLERAASFTALFAQSDLIALGAIRQLRSARRRVPDDVSVVGYDDLPVADFVEPSLTTVHQPMQEVGALAAGLLLDQLTGVATLEPGARSLPAVLVARDSVAAPPDRRRGITGLIGSRH
jgi:DNA-binding LacI/PurR family transcriptional regulator